MMWRRSACGKLGEKETPGGSLQQLLEGLMSHASSGHYPEGSEGSFLVRVTCLRFNHGKVIMGNVDWQEKEQKWDLGVRTCAPGEKNWSRDGKRWVSKDI